MTVVDAKAGACEAVLDVQESMLMRTCARTLVCRIVEQLTCSREFQCILASSVIVLRCRLCSCSACVAVSVGRGVGSCRSTAAVKCGGMMAALCACSRRIRGSCDNRGGRQH